MKTLRAILLSVAVTVVFPLGVAVAEVLECTMDPGFDSAYVSPNIRIEYDKFRTARISDSVIASTDLPSVEGSVEKETDAMIRFLWVVKGVKLRAKDAVLPYRTTDNLIVRLSVKRATGAAILAISGTPFPDAGSLRATGQCQNVD